MHLNNRISISPEGKLFIDNQELDSDIILFEEEAKDLLEEELMEGPLIYYPDDEGYYPISENDDFDLFLDDHLLDNDDISFRDGYFDISNDELDVNY